MLFIPLCPDRVGELFQEYLSRLERDYNVQDYKGNLVQQVSDMWKCGLFLSHYHQVWVCPPVNLISVVDLCVMAYIGLRRHKVLSEFLPLGIIC